MKTAMLIGILVVPVTTRAQKTINPNDSRLFQALGMFESGNNDKAIGKHKERSRYQILPKVWRKFSGLPLNWASNQIASFDVAKKIMASRTLGKKFTPFQWYVLWNAPAELYHPSKIVAERAQRFANLAEVYLTAKPNN